jgi:predicted permease
MPSAPRWAIALLRRLARHAAAEDVVGDLEETHVRRRGRHGRFVASVLTGIEALELAAALLRERLRIGPGISWLDVKLGLRMLVKYPGLTLVGGLALSVAIGLSAAYFEFVNDAMRPRLPLPEGDRVVGIQSWGIVPAGARYSSLEDFVRWRDRLQSFDEVSAFARLRSNLVTGDGRADPVDGVEMSASAFRLTRAAPLLGRTLIDADEAPGMPAVVVIGYRRWHSTFGGDPGIIGRTVRLGGTPATVVGVMPEGFAFPENHDLWVPLRADLAEAVRRPGPTVKVFGRLAPGVTRERAQAELTAIDAPGADTPASGERVRPRIIPYAELFFAGDSDAGLFYVLHAMFPLLLAVVCANVATLVFARTAARTGEIAIRTALGATRRRIVFQLFTEALVLSGVSAAIGLAAAAFGLRRAMQWATATGEPLPFWMDSGLALETLLYVTALAVFASAITGVVPALRATGRSVQERLRELGASGGGLRFGGLWTCVIVFQAALTVALLPIAVTSVWQAMRFESAPVGLPAERYLAGFLLPEERGSAVDALGPAERTARVRATYEEIERRLAAEPGVGAVTFARDLPGMEHRRRRIEVEGADAAPESSVAHEVSMTWVAPDYFDDVESPVLAGRAFGSGDIVAGRAVIVNRSFVRDVLGGRNALGRRIRYVGDAGVERGEWHEVVGVVADLGMNPEDAARAAGIYHPLVPGSSAWVAVRMQGGAAAFAPRLRALVASVDPAIQVNDLQTLADAARRRRAGSWFNAALAGVVGAITLVLSGAGIFALMSFTVTRRTREIGIRSVLGATPRRIVTETFARAASQLGIGLAAGCALAALPGYPGERLPSALAIAAFVAVIGLLACGIPVRRALRIEPTEAVREA